jgi:hypothetical protein
VEKYPTKSQDSGRVLVLLMMKECTHDACKFHYICNYSFYKNKILLSCHLIYLSERRCPKLSVLCRTLVLHLKLRYLFSFLPCMLQVTPILHLIRAADPLK